MPPKKSSSGTRKKTDGKQKSRSASKEEVIEKDSSSRSPNTPRTMYARAHHRVNPILLLDRGTPIEGKEPAILFQTTYSGPQQFKDYVNLASSGKPSIEDCFFQTVFALGLRTPDLSKKNAAQANESGMGVSYASTRKYLASSFGIPHELIKSNRTQEIRNSKGLYDNKVANAYIKDFFTTYLENDHATIFGIDFPKGAGLIDSHVLIAYKSKGTLYFFNPQDKGIIDDKHVISKTLAHLVKYNQSFISALRFFTVSGLDEPVQVLDISCPIPE